MLKTFFILVYRWLFRRDYTKSQTTLKKLTINAALIPATFSVSKTEDPCQVSVTYMGQSFTWRLLPDDGELFFQNLQNFLRITKNRRVVLRAYPIAKKRLKPRDCHIFIDPLQPDKYVYSILFTCDDIGVIDSFSLRKRKRSSSLSRTIIDNAPIDRLSEAFQMVCFTMRKRTKVK
ncbi:hypothetical protein [Alteribacter keqinensis]|uniref:Uncharacterized protein n=1 Tax=Alteribacter keqinensis TaxID=2483800 RepID=A0A3M7TTP4_9BACI|nr:hypothetical protein [Alteribacter keqinensis]RNA68813.1 hypothetical protein EBO34_02275 [Alteribacter keqinensis]